MKRILIIGSGSYIGTSVEWYLARYNAELGKEEYRIDTLSQRDETWETYNFAPYDTIFDVTGIAHVDVDKVSEDTKELYQRINCEWAAAAARKAKRQGVPQFIYMSSVIVYGDSAPLGQKKHITEETPAAPANFYGESKLRAEQKLSELSDQAFHVALIRSPFVYGPNCRGNYPLLARMAEKTSVFPKIENERSMIYVENLAEFLRMLIDSGKGGLFFPQNGEYTTTARMVQLIGAAREKKIQLWNALNPLVKLAARVPGRVGKMANKAFGSLTIDQELSKRDFKGYQIYSLEESIRKTERAWK